MLSDPFMDTRYLFYPIFETPSSGLYGTLLSKILGLAGQGFLSTRPHEIRRLRANPLDSPSLNAQRGLNQALEQVPGRSANAPFLNAKTVSNSWETQGRKEGRKG